MTGQPPGTDSDDRSPSRTYIQRELAAESRLVGLYWPVRWFFAVIAEGLRQWAGWWRQFATGTLPTIGKECRLRGCSNQAVTRIAAANRPTRTAVCRRHFLAVIAIVYGLLSLACALLAGAGYLLVVMTR